MGITYSNKLQNLSSQTARPLFQRLDDTGLGSGTTNLNGNYAVPTKFKISGVAGQLLVVKELHIYIEDGGNLDAGSYGNGIALTNGIRVETTQDGVNTGLTNNNILTNAHWTRTVFEQNVITFGAGNNALAFRWDIEAALVPLALGAGDELAIILNDNFTGLVSHSFSVRGYRFLF